MDTSRHAERARAIVRAILSTLEPASVVPFLAAVRVWFRAVVSIAVEGDAFVADAEGAECNATEQASHQAFEAMVAAWTFRSACELVSMAAEGDRGDRDDVVTEARDAIEMIAALIAEHEAPSAPEPAIAAPVVDAPHADPVAVFLDTLTEFAVFLDNGDVALAAAHIARGKRLGAEHVAMCVVCALRVLLKHRGPENIRTTEKDGHYTRTGFDRSAEHARRIADLLTSGADALDHLTTAGGIK